MLEFDIGPQKTEPFTYQFANPYEAPPGQIRFSGLVKGDAAQKAVLPSHIDFTLTQFRYPTCDIGTTYTIDLGLKKNGRFKFKEDFPGITFGMFDKLEVDITPKDGTLKTNSMFAMT